MTERARALIERMVVFGDTIGERVGLMFLTYYGAQALTYVSVADVIRRSVCVDLESLPPAFSARHEPAVGHRTRCRCCLTATSALLCPW